MSSKYSHSFVREKSFHNSMESNKRDNCENVQEENRNSKRTPNVMVSFVHGFKDVGGSINQYESSHPERIEVDVKKCNRMEDRDKVKVEVDKGALGASLYNASDMS